MHDFEMNSGCESEQSIYEKFLDFLQIRRIIDALWDILDSSEDDIHDPHWYSNPNLEDE